MATLHTVNKSPFQNQTLMSCLQHTKPGDSVLMIEDGVYGAAKGTQIIETVVGLGVELKLYVLAPDVIARGIDAGRIADEITSIDYDGFVDLVANHDRTQNWL